MGELMIFVVTTLGVLLLLIRDDRLVTHLGDHRLRCNRGHPSAALSGAFGTSEDARLPATLRFSSESHDNRT